MAATFGGTAYRPDGKGGMTVLKGDTGLGAYCNAFVPGGYDTGETTYQNVEGNHVGSWLIRMNWDTDMWRFSVYADKYFEDHSAMFQLDYDGYGQGEEWDEKKKSRYVLYDFKDIMLGMELNIKYDRWINDVVFEYIYSNTKAARFIMTIQTRFQTTSEVVIISITTLYIQDGNIGGRLSATLYIVRRYIMKTER